MPAIPQSAKELFNDLLPQALASFPDKAREVGSVYSFKIEGEGEWTVDLKAETPKVEVGVRADANCTISVAGSDFVEMLKNPQLGMQLFMQGKLKVAGDPMLAMKLQKLFNLGA